MIAITKDNFEKEVLQAECSVLVDFWAAWCMPCKMLSPILEEVANSRAGYNIMKIDVDKNPDVTTRLSIDTIPTICIFKDGKLINKKIGYMSKEELINFIEENS